MDLDLDGLALIPHEDLGQLLGGGARHVHQVRNHILLPVGTSS